MAWQESLKGCVIIRNCICLHNCNPCIVHCSMCNEGADRKHLYINKNSISNGHTIIIFWHASMMKKYSVKNYIVFSIYVNVIIHTASWLNMSTDTDILSRKRSLSVYFTQSLLQFRCPKAGKCVLFSLKIGTSTCPFLRDLIIWWFQKGISFWVCLFSFNLFRALSCKLAVRFSIMEATSNDDRHVVTSQSSHSAVGSQTVVQKSLTDLLHM